MSHYRPDHRIRFALCLGLVATSASARAHAAEALAVVGVAIEGDTPAPTDLAAALRRGFVQGGFAVAAAKLEAGPACNQHDCYAPLAAKYKANLLAWAKVQSSPQTYEVEIRVVAADSGEAITVDHIRCAADDLCPPMPQTMQRLAKEAGRKVRLRLAEAPAAKAPPPPVEVREPMALASPAPPPPPADVTATFAPPRVYDVPAPVSAAPLWLAGASVAVLGVSGLMFAYDNTCDQAKNQPQCSPHELTALAVGVGLAGLVGLGTATAWWLSTPTPVASTPVGSQRGLAMVPWAISDGAGLRLFGRLP